MSCLQSGCDLQSCPVILPVKLHLYQFTVNSVPLRTVLQPVSYTHLDVYKRQVYRLRQKLREFYVYRVILNFINLNYLILVRLEQMKKQSPKY